MDQSPGCATTSAPKKKKRITIVMDPCVNNIVNDIYFNKQATAILPTHQRLKSHCRTLKLKAPTLSVNLGSMDKFLFHSHRSALQVMQSQRVVSDVARTLKLKALTPCVSHRLTSHRKTLKLKALTLSVKLESMNNFLVTDPSSSSCKVEEL